MVHQWGFFGSISAIRKIWSLTANSRSLQAAALKSWQSNLGFLSFKYLGQDVLKHSSPQPSVMTQLCCFIVTIVRMELVLLVEA